MMKGQKRSSKLYVLQGLIVTGDATVATLSLSDGDVIRLCHMHLGHISENRMVELSIKGIFNGQSISKLKFYEHCFFGKQRRVKSIKSIHKTKGTLGYIYYDLQGPSRVPFKGGYSYMLTIINDFSRKFWVFFLKQKSDVLATFKDWKIMIEKQIEKQVKHLCTNNGLEFCYDELNALRKLEGIVRHHTVCHTLHQIVWQSK